MQIFSPCILDNKFLVLSKIPGFKGYMDYKWLIPQQQNQPDKLKGAPTFYSEDICIVYIFHSAKVKHYDFSEILENSL